MTKEFEDLTYRIDAIGAKLKPLLSKLAAARNAYYTNPTAQNEIVLRAIDAEARALHDESSRLIEQLPAASGLPPEIFEERDENSDARQRKNQLPCESLTVDQVESTADINALLPEALERIESLLPSGWSDDQPMEAARIGSLLDPESFLSLTKSTRINSEGGNLHRLRQAIFLGRDYLDGHPLYDHFEGAALTRRISRSRAIAAGDVQVWTLRSASSSRSRSPMREVPW